MTETRACEPASQDLLAAYLGHARELGLGGRAMRDRDRIARHFLTRHPDLRAWMTIPAAGRATELKRTGAWPLVCFAIGTGQLRLDLDLTVLGECLAVLLAWHGGPAAALTAEAVDAFEAALSSSMTMPPAPQCGLTAPARQPAADPVRDQGDRRPAPARTASPHPGAAVR